MKDQSNNPVHVALIMDGNRRWARERKHPLFMGHDTGAKCIEPIVERAVELRIQYLTFWAFSTENWARNKMEVEILMKVFRDILNGPIMKRLIQKGVRLQTIGDISKFPKDIYETLLKKMKESAQNSTITVILALNYGGRDEILRAIEKARKSVKLKDQSLQLEQKDFEMYLDTAGIPDPELIVRTGGVKRMSGFMLWQSEYSEYYFSDVLWPDFDQLEFQKAIDDYGVRQRRFGK